MDRRQKTGLSQLKVGIFVLAGLTIAAVGVLSIGTVSIFAPKFEVRTYLAGVSGLKEGDLVLLAGVEVGNVSEVLITEQPPQTEANRQAELQISETSRQIELLQQGLDAQGRRLEGLRNQQLAAQQREPARARALQLELEREQRVLDGAARELENAQSRLENAKASLQSISVTMLVDKKYEGRIRKDSTVSLGSIGLMGDKYIEISLGRTATPPDRDTDGVIVVPGSRVTDFREIMTGVDDVIANFGVLSGRMENIMAKFDEGQGTIGSFINDPAFYNNLNETVLEAKRAVTSTNDLINTVQGGSGTVGKLINDSEVYDRLTATTEKLSTLVDRLNSKEGSLGKFINDTTFHDTTTHVVSEVDAVVQKINRGEGTLGKLTTDDALYASMRDSVQKLNTLLDDINQGKGTLGKLAQDQQMYDNVNEASSEVVKLLYDFRKDPKKYLTINFKIF